MAGYPGGFNTFVPSFDATGHLVVAYSRNPKDFSINEYTTLTPVKKSTGYYLRITPEQAARVLNTNLAEFIWPDGNDAPSGEWNTESFGFVPYTTTRYNFPFRLGYKAEQQADWKILAAHSAFAAQDAMTARTLRVVTAITTTGNYSSSHVKTAKQWQATLNGTQAFLNAGTTSNPAVKNTLNGAAQQINIDTLGRVRPPDLVVVLSPNLAATIAASSEIQDYVKNSPFALAQIRGDVKSQNGMWGLPDTLYGYKVVIEDAVRVSSRKGASSTSVGYIMGNNTIAMVARPGSLVNDAAGGPSWSTCHVMSYEEMTVEQKDDVDNRRIAARVVEDYDVQIVAPASGALITNCLS